jgi:hypothetical protein
MRVKSPHAESPRFPARRSSEQGESAPKARLKSVVDGNQVNIPGLFIRGDVGTKKARLSQGLVDLVLACRWKSQVNPVFC